MQRPTMVHAPPMLYGTAWKDERTRTLVHQAISLGFRGIDTACQPKHYNEKGVGDGIADALAADPSIRREDLFIQTKFSPHDCHSPNHINPPDPSKAFPYHINDRVETQVEKSIAASLRNLQTTYLDSWVLHGPLESYDQTLLAWRAMERYVDNNAVYQLGISNCYSLQYLQRLAKDAKHPPRVIQNRFYRDAKWDVDIRAWARENGVTYQSFWTLTANPDLLSSHPVRRSASLRGVSSETVLYGYLIQRGCQPLNGSCSPHHIKADLVGIGTPLNEDEMKAIGALIRDKF